MCNRRKRSTTQPERNLEEVTKLTNSMLLRQDAVIEYQCLLTFQPVTLNVLPALPTVRVRSCIPGRVADRSRYKKKKKKKKNTSQDRIQPNSACCITVHSTKQAKPTLLQMWSYQCCSKWTAQLVLSKKNLIHSLTTWQIKWITFQRAQLPLKFALVPVEQYSRSKAHGHLF